MSNTIKLMKYSDHIEELTATAVAITPGMLLQLDSTAKQVEAHATAGGNVLPMFALEDELQGKSISDNYAVSVKIQCWIPYRGDEVYAILKDDNSVAVGDFLESAGGGLLQAHTADISNAPNVTAQIVAQALEAVDLTGDSSTESSESPLGVNRRIRVKIL